MTDPTHLRSSLAAIYEMKFQRQGKTLADLAEELGVSKTYASLYLNGKLAAPSKKLLSRVRDFVKRHSITRADEQRMMEILKILDRADDPGSIRAALIVGGDGS